MGVRIRQRPKNSGVWWIFINHNGKRMAKKVGRSKKEAQEIAQVLEAKLTLGDLSIIEDKHESTFGEYTKKYVDVQLAVSCKISTQKNYKLLYRKHVLPELENVKIKDINRFRVKQFLLSKLNKGYSASTVNHMKCAISNVLNLAVDDEIILANPAHRLGNFLSKAKQNTENTEKKIHPLTKNELAHLLEAFKKHFPQHYPLVLTLARTGMRIGEALGLQWDDIDFKNRTINIQRSYSKGKIDTPKSGKSRTVDMSTQLTEMLKDLEWDRLINTKWIFNNEMGNPINAENWRKRVFYELLKKAGLRQMRIHDLRHTYASLLLQAGAPMHYVKDQLGHYSIKVTVDIYGHIMPGVNKGIVDRLDDTDNYV